MKLKAFVIAYIILWVLLLIAGLFMMLVGQEPTQEDVETMFMIPYEVASEAQKRYGPDYLYYLAETCIRTGFDWEQYSQGAQEVMDQIESEMMPEEVRELALADGPNKTVYEILSASYGRYETFFVPDTYYQYFTSADEEPSGGKGNEAGTGKSEEDGAAPEKGEIVSTPGGGSAGHNGGGGRATWEEVTVIMRYKLAINDDYGNARTFGGDRKHLGNDIMGSSGIPLVSVSDGVITNLGWNTLGGNRVGITTTTMAKDLNGSDTGNPYKTYYYYAHLDEINPALYKGQMIKAGDLIGTIGDSGYGTDGTTGKFPSHLHFQIGLISSEMEDYLWIDPNPIIRIREDDRKQVNIRDVYEMIGYSYLGQGENLREVELKTEKRERQ